ncbi:MAG: hypothetical protein NTU44_07010 [Bacteroidetes bacterium]|nr:hypothetical protein [Bacteroidota bacterium]
MNDKGTDWNYHEFKVYLLLYAANADFELKEEEKQKILSKATWEEYKHIHKVFEKDSDFERIEKILSFRDQFFPTEEEIGKLLTDVSELFETDDDYNTNERNFFVMLKKFLRK